MVEVTIYFHHGGEWLTSPEPHYDRGCVTNWKGYDPDLISFIDLVNEYINKLGFVGVQELIVLAPIGKYFKIIDCELSVDVTDIVMHDGSFLLSPIVNEGTDCSESEDDSNNGMVFSCSDYDTDELENFVTKKERNITDSLQDYKEIVKGMAFKDIAEAKQFCKLYALAKKVELVVVKSDKKRLRYTCAADGCQFLLLISGDLTTPGVSVKTLVDHIECGTTYDNSLVDYSTIALYFKDKLQSDPKYKVKEMNADLHRVFELNVSEAKCKRAKKEVLESLEGSFVDSYNKLEGYATKLRSCNTGSDIVIDFSKEALSNGKRKFLKMYICFKAIKLGFKSGLRPLIGLDGAFFKGKTKGQVLCVVGQDSNNSFYPLAWAVVDKETKRTWTWFMQHLQHSLELQNGEGLTFISDMQKGLLEAVRTVLPEAHKRYCVRHIEANWFKKWGKGELKKLLWWAAWSSFTEEFEDQLQEMKEVNGEAVDNNFTESFNAWILEARYKPIIGMLEDIRVKTMERLAAKEVAVRKWKDDGFSPKSELLFIQYLKISKVCKVSGNGDNGYEVTEGADRHIVNLREKKCTCRTWNLTGIPCPHAIKAMEHKKMIPKKEIHWYYSKEAALAVYKHKLQPVRGEPFWKCDPLHAIEPPELVKLVGRPKLMREREKDEVVKRQGVWKQTRKGKMMTCSNCGEQNHNARGCEKGKKRQLRRGLVDEDEASEEDINCTAPQPTQESQFEYASSSSYFPVAEDDDEDPRLRPRRISEEAFLTRLRKKQNSQEPIGSRVIGFRGDKFGVSEPTNLPIGPTGLTWNGQGAVTTN
ncbi:hypothetical protein KY290_036391 [Solanum tuberosum]|uniref:SWIM-type domain-containing protein n=1 Tax=Solanum tuberosum TaxID=4113 RepID=A0ABQ7TU63_SOLTU|nr:hypothetical protein KY285_037611 [Solanum tuberosum]KAH0737686.1 hypothetical protein KY290_036391 [Solanum tuberosum]